MAKKDGRLTTAFASTARERFVGPGPWKVFTLGGYIETPSADPAFLYQDVVVGLAPERKINNGQPTLHAFCLAALNVKEGETVIHIGAGTGYYSALLAKLTGPTGSVAAYEIEQDLAKDAARNLADFSNVAACHRSGSEGSLISALERLLHWISGSMRCARTAACCSLSLQPMVLAGCLAREACF